MSSTDLLRYRDIKDKIPELCHGEIDWKHFVRLGNLTKLRVDSSGKFHHANYESGLLLYSLVRHYRPSRILEIGTGRGYGAICMAHALRDSGVPGRIITIDTVPHAEKQPWSWPIDDGSGPRVEQFSVKEVWERYFSPELRNLVEFRKGSSVHAMRALREEGWRADFVYIDGDHTYASAKHDFFAALLIVDNPFCMLLDDYTPRSHKFGVRKMVEQYIAPCFDTEIIYNDRRWFGEEYEKEAVGARDHAQVLIDSRRLRSPIETTLSRAKLARSVDVHRRWGWLAVKMEDLKNTLRPS